MLGSTIQIRPGKPPSRVQVSGKEACCLFVNREDEEEYGPRRYGDEPKCQDELPILQYHALELALTRREMASITAVSNDVHLAAITSNAQRMVLHAGTAADITKHKDLCGSLRSSRGIAIPMTL